MIAITGAGEYLDIIRPYDEILLNKLKDDPYVVCFPTAAGLESNERIQYWLDLGDDHFSKLNVNHKSIRALNVCLLYTSPSPRDATLSRMPSSA